LHQRQSLTLALILVAAAYVLPAQLAPRRFPTDDSFFYLQVARNIAAGYGSTFNTVSPTNGYHPLWIGPCVLAEMIARGDRDLALRIVFAMQAALALGAIALFRASARALGIQSWPLSAPVLAAFFLTGLYGSEAHINGFCILASLLLLNRHAKEPSRWSALLLGISLGFSFLARLDNVFLVAAVAIVAAWSAGKSAPARAAAFGWIVLPIIALALPYLEWNVAVFGHVIPISGAIKSTFPEFRPDLRNLGTLGLMSLAGGVVAVVLFARRGTPDLRRTTLLPLAAGVVTHAIYIVGYTDHNTHWSWYYVPGVTLLAFLLAIGADALSRRLQPRAWRIAVGIAVILLTGWGVTRGWARYRNADAASHNQFVFELLPTTPYDRWTVQFARWMDANLPKGAGVLAFDYPGAMAYYSSLRIVTADGLMGDFEFDEELRRGGLERFLAAHDIGYYLGPGPASADRCDSALVRAPLTHIPVGEILRCPGDLVTTSTDATRGVEEPGVTLHRIRRVLPAPPNAAREPVVKHGALW